MRELNSLQVGTVKENEPLANHTTMKIGGPADLFIEPSSIEKVKAVMELVKKYQLPWRAIGRGSNLLVSDKGVPGVVIKLSKGLDHLFIDGEGVTAGGGHPLIVLAAQVSRNGLKGLEFAGGIPASVGGAVYMNAGAHGSDISAILDRAHILFEDGLMQWLSNEDMAFSYRTSILQNERPGIVLEAVFKLNKGERAEVTKNMKIFKDYRRETQPWDRPCAGSIFRNPLPEYAGNLIEKAGLKGHRIGGAQISDVHGNFIVNIGEASAEDVLGLIDHAKTVIYDKFNINMETEVEIIGRK
nr:UDP-N-acetylmuramate dehydrogenase [Bacillus aerolatus]